MSLGSLVMSGWKLVSSNGHCFTNISMYVASFNW